MINLTEDPWKNELAVRRMVSIELQFFAWMRLVDDRKIARCIDLKRGGYQLYMRRSMSKGLIATASQISSPDFMAGPVQRTGCPPVHQLKQVPPSLTPEHAGRVCQAR